MIRYILLIFFTFTILYARENPFFPVQGEQDIPITSNQEIQLDPLKRATITLPSTARVIEGVTIKYKTLDGAQHTKSIELNNAVDWHLPVFISQTYGMSDRSNTVVQKKLVKKKAYREIGSLEFIKFFESGKYLKIVTQDKMLRNFILVKPHRIVCDFQRETDFGSYVKRAPKDSKFKKIRIGTHKAYYRVVIELDGYYSYKIQKKSDAYLIVLR